MFCTLVQHSAKLLGTTLGFAAMVRDPSMFSQPWFLWLGITPPEILLIPKRLIPAVIGLWFIPPHIDIGAFWLASGYKQFKA